MRSPAAPDDANDKPRPFRLTERIGIVTVGAFLGLATMGAVLFLLWSWSMTEAAKTGKRSATVQVLWFHLGLSPDLSLMCIVIGTAGIGSLVHAIMSFSSFVGNHQFRNSWAAWYLLRVFLGVNLGLLVYLMARAGIVTATSAAAVPNEYGAAAVGGFAGIFAKQAADKLEELLDVVFSTGPGYGDARRADRIFASSSSPSESPGSDTRRGT